MGHLGYSIHPKERGRGRGVHLLNFALEYCRGLGIWRVVVSAGKNNSASKRLIEKCGGIYQYSLNINAAEEYLVYWFGGRMGSEKCAKVGLYYLLSRFSNCTRRGGFLFRIQNTLCP
ncbi:MAG TPA: GNAT family N-acetyltransferase [Firmicutes bacterium]|nr:GNAT family N-acetyltransferase [Bacillota bacterium]